MTTGYNNQIIFNLNVPDNILEGNYDKLYYKLFEDAIVYCRLYSVKINKLSHIKSFRKYILGTKQ